MFLGPIVRSRRPKFDAASYTEWREKAQERDRQSGAAAWKEAEKSELYGYKSIKHRLDTLRSFRAEGDNHGLLFNLNEGIHGNMDGMGSEKLYQRASFGTKRLIEDYVQEIASALDHLASPEASDIDEHEKRDFFRRAMLCYGRSALMLSGSGSFLYFHMGVVKAMWEQGLLPDIISGSSGGSIVGAVVCTHKDDEIGHYLDPAMIEANSVLATDPLAPEVGKRLSAAQVYREISQIIPDLTFQEAFELTGRQLNVSVAPAEKHQNSRLLNAIASPNVMIREAVMASCAVPGVFPAVTLMARNHKGERVPYHADRKWVDGSVTNDLPAKRLGRLYAVNHYIVSQANPAVTPFISDMKSPGSAYESVKQASVSTMKAWMNANMEIWQRPLSYFPAVNGMANMAMTIVDQDYSGDITIVNPPRLWPLEKILGRLSVEEMCDLVATGEKATWPRIEMIRNQTLISKTLSRIVGLQV